MAYIAELHLLGKRGFALAIEHGTCADEWTMELRNVVLGSPCQ